ncbi:ATP-binding cassette domain-containing protein [Arthrobacter psychrolactophilus]
MSLIRLNDVSVRFDKVQVLREAFFKLDAGDRVGMIGRNGSGKSTLLKLVMDQVEPDSGTVAVELGTKIGYFSQFSELNGAQSILEVLEEVFSHVLEIEAELAQIDAELGAEPGEADMTASSTASRNFSRTWIGSTAGTTSARSTRC